MSTMLPQNECCGCSACAEKCPQHCISMTSDCEGFVYPEIDLPNCTHCGLCEKKCPILNTKEPQSLSNIYAAINKDEKIRKGSSSGGIFTMIAERIIEEGGVVFGAKFSNRWEVVHGYIESKEEIAMLRGSKYVQSKVEQSYQQVKAFLKQNRKVLFSGTPCQIAGLKAYLHKIYPNLITLDFICHGVPSPKVLNKYIDEKVDTRKSIRSIQFRNKDEGWKKFCFTLDFIPSYSKTPPIHEASLENDFLKGFIHNLYLRPSCHTCHFKSFRSGSDITLADAWGIQYYRPEIDDDKGISLVIPLTPIGVDVIQSIRNDSNSHFIEIDKEIIEIHNPGAYHSAKVHKNRKKFFQLLNKEELDFKSIIKRCLPPPTYWDKLMWSINKRIIKYGN